MRIVHYILALFFVVVLPIRAYGAENISSTVSITAQAFNEPNNHVRFLGLPDSVKGNEVTSSSSINSPITVEGIIQELPESFWTQLWFLASTLLFWGYFSFSVHRKRKK